MTLLTTALFALTYVGMALGRVPGSRVDRTGIAMIVAVVLVAAGAVPGGEIAAAIHFPTLLLLAGLMILSARVGAAGFYDAAAAWIARQAGQPLRLLALTIAIGGVLSAFLVNDDDSNAMLAGTATAIGPDGCGAMDRSEALSPTPTPGTDLPSDVAGLIEYANFHFETAQAALRAGDFATYGAEIALVEAALRRLETLAPGLATPLPGATASPAP